MCFYRSLAHLEVASKVERSVKALLLKGGVLPRLASPNALGKPPHSSLEIEPAAVLSSLSSMFLWTISTRLTLNIASKGFTIFYLRIVFAVRYNLGTRPKPTWRGSISFIGQIALLPRQNFALGMLGLGPIP